MSIQSILDRNGGEVITSRATELVKTAADRNRARGIAALVVTNGDCGTRDLTMPRRQRHSITALPTSSDHNHRLVSFPSGKGRNTAFWREPTTHTDPGLLLSFAQFERDGLEDDYRHRMIMNGLALIVVVILIVIGVWMMTNIDDQHYSRLYPYAYQLS
jgi:hypothetical protein